MLQQILSRIRENIPDVKIVPSPVKFLGEAVSYRFIPCRSENFRPCARLELRFISQSMQGAMKLYKAARRSVVSEYGTDKISEGTHIEEISQGASSGYISGTGLYYVKAGFLVNYPRDTDEKEVSHEQIR